MARDDASRKSGVLMLCIGIYPDRVGGAEIHAYNSACRLAELGHRVYVITTASNITTETANTENTFTKIAIGVWARPFVFVSYILKALVFGFKLRERVDIAHAHTADFPTMITAFLFSVFSHKSYIVSSMGSDIRISSRKFLYRTMQLPFLRNAKKVVAVSSEIAVLLEQNYGIPRSKITVVGSGYDDAITSKIADTMPHNVTKKPKRIICVANMRPEKDHMTLLKAFAKLSNSMNDVQLYLVGTGLLRMQLEEFCIKNNLQNVKFLGRLPNHLDVLRQIAEADVFALTSVEEGLPNVVIEALALGKPVVATAVGGIPEVVRQGVNGILVPPKSPDHVTSALERLLSDSVLREKLSEASHRSVKDYTWSKIAEKYERIYSAAA